MTQAGRPHDSRRLDTALERQQPSRRRWRAWTDQEPALGGLSWPEFRHELRHGPADRQDELLAAVVRIARHDDEAVGVVIACLLPGLRARIARHAPGLGREDAWSIAVTGLCHAVAQHEPPTRFVASRLLDVAKRHLQRAVTTEAAWRQHSHKVPDQAGLELADEPSAGLILSTAVTAGVVTGPDAWLLHTTLVGGHSLPWAAGRLGISYENAKKRRQRAEARCEIWWTDRGIRSLPRADADVGDIARRPVAGGDVA